METRREEIDPFEGIDDPTLWVQMQHEIRAIEELVFVTKLSFVPVHKDKTQGFRDTLSCALCRWYNSWKGQEQAVQLSRERTTLLACLQELRKHLQDRHGFRCDQAVTKKADDDADSAATVSPDLPNVLQAMMQLRQAKSRAEVANKLVLEVEKERDATEKAVEELKRQMQPKRPRTDDDAGDAHEMLVNVDNWDLRDHRQQTTRVQNRHNVQVGSRQNQVKTRTCFGDSGGNDRQLVRAARRRFRPQRSDTVATRGGGAWRTTYAPCHPQTDSRYGYQEVCTFCG